LSGVARLIPEKSWRLLATHAHEPLIGGVDPAQQHLMNPFSVRAFAAIRAMLTMKRGLMP
jgi:hypothetical protein